MTIFLPLIPDFIIAAVLVLFAWRGAKRGMILTLCSLVALIVAFIGATYFARYLAPPVSAMVEPYLASAIEQTVTEQTVGTAPEVTDPGAAPDTLPDRQTQGDATDTTDGDVDIRLGALDMFLHADWYERIADAARQGMTDSISAVSKSLAKVLADMISYIVLFLFGFVVILLLWFIFSHALDLAFRLPVLDTFNTAGGLLLGLLKALVLLFMIGSVLQRYPDAISETMVDKTYLLRFFMTVSPWSLLRG